jgi:hypothetical protein
MVANWREKTCSERLFTFLRRPNADEREATSRIAIGRRPRWRSCSRAAWIVED